MYMVQKLELFPTSYEYSIGKYNNLKEMFIRGDVDISGNIAMSGNINTNGNINFNNGTINFIFDDYDNDNSVSRQNVFLRAGTSASDPKFEHKIVQEIDGVLDSDTYEIAPLSDIGVPGNNAKERLRLGGYQKRFKEVQIVAQDGIKVWAEHSTQNTLGNIECKRIDCGEIYATGRVTANNFIGDASFGNLDISGQLKVNYNESNTTYIGKTKIGYVSSNINNSGFSHLNSNINEYALVQTNDGDTILNCANEKKIYLINNNNVNSGITFDGTTLDMNNKTITNASSINANSFIGDGSLLTNLPSVIPSLIGNSGKYLTTDGTNLSWANVSSSGGGSVTTGIVGYIYYDGVAQNTINNNNLTATRQGSGIYNITFTTARSNVNYLVFGQIIEPSSTKDDIKIHVEDGSQTINGFTVNIYEGDNGGSSDTHRDRKFYLTIIDDITTNSGSGNIANLTDYSDASFGNVDVGGNLEVTGISTFTTNVTVMGNLKVDGLLDMSNNIIMNNNRILFSASDSSIIPPDSGIITKVQNLETTINELITRIEALENP